MEISADVIGLPAHRSSFADGRGKEIAILVILASVKSFLYCVHSYLLDFILLSCDRSVSFCKNLLKALVLTAEVHFRCCDAVFLLPLLCHSINQKLAWGVATL